MNGMIETGFPASSINLNYVFWRPSIQEILRGGRMFASLSFFFFPLDRERESGRGTRRLTLHAGFMMTCVNLWQKYNRLEWRVWGWMMKIKTLL